MWGRPRPWLHHRTDLPREEGFLNKRVLLAAPLALILAGASRADEAVKLDPKLPKYRKVQGIRGNLSSIGSDTMNNLMTLWAEGFKKFYPGVNVQVEGKGSSTAPPALVEGTAQLGPMSRDMKAEETDAIEKKYGFKPTRVRTSLDALAIYVSKDNPVQSLTLRQADAIFSRSRKSGYAEDVTTWGQVGLAGAWARRPLSLYGRNSASGTYGFFKDHVLKKGDFKDTVKEQPGSASVVEGVSGDPAGIGYSGAGYATSGVRALPLASDERATPVQGTYENLLNGKYPLGRYLNLYVVKEPGKPLDPLRREFIRYILSQEGQGIVVKDGYFPLPASTVVDELKRIDVELELSDKK